MAVYTQIEYSELKKFFSHYELGTVICFEGIEDGIDNSNFFVTTSQGEFVFTLFESIATEQLPHFLNLLSHLDNHAIPCPTPKNNLNAETVNFLNNKPAAIFKRLPGIAIKNPTETHCHALGLQLGKFHLVTQNYDFPLENNRNLKWCKMIFPEIKNHLSSEDCQLITEELQFQTENLPYNLPQGLIHGDLFKDNVLFQDNKVSGLLDIYDASSDSLLLDIAITINDWCIDNGHLNQKKLTAMLSAYESLRPIKPIEKQHLATLLRFGALRFWMSRLHHQLYPRPGELTLQKNPVAFREILRLHRQETPLAELAE